MRQRREAKQIATGKKVKVTREVLEKEARRLFALASAQGNAQATEHLKTLDELIRTECPFLGTRVIITGTSRADLNGKAGVATDFDHAKGRYVVTLNGKDGKVLKLKPSNVNGAT